MNLMVSRLLSSLLLASLLSSVVFMPSASAHNRRNWYRNERSGGYENQWLGWKGKKVLKGAAIGAGVGAATGAITDRSIGKGAVLGSVVGAGVQTVRYSNWW
jgi:hypothetical protein